MVRGNSTPGSYVDTVFILTVSLLQQRMRWLDGITDSMDMFEQTTGDGEGQGRLGMLQSMVSQRVRHNLATEQQSLLQTWSIFNHHSLRARRERRELKQTDVCRER